MCRLFKTCPCLVQESNYIRVAQRTMGSSSAVFLSHFVSKKCTSLDQPVLGVSQRYQSTCPGSGGARVELRHTHNGFDTLE